MAAPIGPGDWCECVGPFVGGEHLSALRSAGYRFVGSYHVGLMSICEAVTDRMQMPDGSIRSGIKVRDVKAFNRAGQECWLLADQWRPIYTPKQEIIEALKAPPKHAPVRELKPA